MSVFFGYPKKIAQFGGFRGKKSPSVALTGKDSKNERKVESLLRGSVVKVHSGPSASKKTSEMNVSRLSGVRKNVAGPITILFLK